MICIASLNAILSPGTSEAVVDKRRISVATFMFCGGDEGVKGAGTSVER